LMSRRRPSSLSRDVHGATPDRPRSLPGGGPRTAPRPRGAIAAAFLLLAGCAATPGGGTTQPLLTHGAAVGEVSSTSAVFWGRCSEATALRVQLDGRGQVFSAEAAAAHDFNGKVEVRDLAPDTAYSYRIWCGDGRSSALAGSFRTAPVAEQPAAVRFVWGGDVGGQNVCRDAEVGYDIFERVRERDPVFFIGLGDMIYADDACTEVGLYHNRQIVGPGPSEATTPSFWEHWRYNRADAASQRLLLSTSYYGVWDDHEISNDAGPQHDTLPSAPDQHRFAPARAAFVDYLPMLSTEKLYRSARWGKNLELFILDTRGYRDLNTAPDVGAEPKTMLGAEQRAWLIDGLTGSDATWKVVVSSVPIAVPTAGDGWTNYHGKKGFEREFLAILAAAERAHVENMVWITTDIHFATGFRFTPTPGFEFLEFTSGPLNAGMFPKPDLDETLHPERLFLYGGPLPQDAHSFAQASAFFNFGEIDIAADGELTLRVVNRGGEVAVEKSYSPAHGRTR
jgi:alkaline phosphatase D